MLAHHHSVFYRQHALPAVGQSTEGISVVVTHTHTDLMALFRDYPGEPVPERQNQSGFY